MIIKAVAMKGYPADAPLPDKPIVVRDGLGGPPVGTATLRRSDETPGDILATIDLTSHINTGVHLCWNEEVGAHAEG